MGGGRPHHINFDTGTIWNADNLKVMRGMNSQTVDLIYLDPPFNSAKNYRGRGKAKKQEFMDDWNEANLHHWNMLEGIRADSELLKEESWWPLMELVKEKHSEEMYYYLCFMAVRILQMRRILCETGTIYLHCDDSSNSYLRMIMDFVFGKDKGAGAGGRGAEITWQRTSARNNATSNFGRISDTIYVYRKSSKFTHNPQYTSYDDEYIRKNYKYNDNDGRGLYRIDNLTAPGSNNFYEYKGYTPKTRGWSVNIDTMREYDEQGRLYFPINLDGVIAKKNYLKDGKGTPVGNVWTDINPIASGSKERTGWDTQKPLSLLNRILLASSNKGDIVFDPFCGCATTLLAAANNNRKFIGCDIDSEVVDIALMRWEDQYDMLYENKDKEVQESIRLSTILPSRTDLKPTASIVLE